MRPLSIDQKIFGGFGLAVLLLAIVALVSYRDTREFREASRWVAHTQEVMVALESVLSTMKDVQLGQRGYVITGDQQFLKPYHVAVSRIQPIVAHARRLTADNPRQQRNFDDLEPMIVNALSFQRDVVTQRATKGFEGPQRLLLKGEGERRLDAIRRQIDTMMTEERRLLEFRTAQFDARARTTLGIITLGGVLALFIVVVACVIVKRELVARRLAETEIKLRSSQLEAANKELEAFSYSVSHDLRAPLRHIDGFAEMLQKHAVAALDEKGRRYLETISEAAKRMGRLIDDLLDFSRTGRAEMRKARVSMEGLVKEVLNDLRSDLQGRKITWKNGHLPEAHGDPAMLRQVLVNLIGNAVKYTLRCEDASIEIGCASSPQEETVFFIRDNGAGFDMRYAHKLFGIFQRLHGTTEFEGTGIGLANVRRIILRHGGRVWAEGAVGQGATFYFALPKHGGLS